MSGDHARRLAQLRQAYDSGLLDEDTYQAAVRGLDAETGAKATLEGSGAIAQYGSVGAVVVPNGWAAVPVAFAGPRLTWANDSGGALRDWIRPTPVVRLWNMP